MTSSVSDEEFHDSFPFEVKHTSHLIIKNYPVIYTFAITNPRDLIRFSEIYTWNRSINQEHVDQIIKDLKDMEHPFIVGTFKLIVNTKTGEKMKIYDGQHRFKAFEGLLEEDTEHNWDIPTPLEIYSFSSDDTIETSPIAKHLFELANKTHPFDKMNDSIDIYFEEITNGIANIPLFKNGIEMYKDKCSKPRISKKDIFNILTKSFKPITKPSVEEVILLFKRKNNSVSLFPVEKIIGSLTPNDQYNKASKANFFLNIRILGKDSTTVIPFENRVKEIVNELNKR
jgi:hypothetical protein